MTRRPFNVRLEAKWPNDCCSPEDESEVSQHSLVEKSAEHAERCPDYSFLFIKLVGLCGGEGGTRTPDPVIMSHVL